MTTPIRTLLALLTAALLAQPLAAQQPPSQEYMRLIFEAGLLFQQKDFDAVMKKLDEADDIQLDVPIALNMRGAVLTETGEFGKAESFFKQAVERQPEYFAPRFNLGEILFLQKDYKGAASHYESMLQDFPDNEVLLYKISLSHLMAGNEEKAREWRDKISFPSNTPSYYFAHAAHEFHRDNKAEGDKWIASSMRIFGDGGNLFFLQSLEDLGWVDPAIVKMIADKNIENNARRFGGMQGDGSKGSSAGSSAGAEAVAPSSSAEGKKSDSQQPSEQPE